MKLTQRIDKKEKWKPISVPNKKLRHRITITKHIYIIFFVSVSDVWIEIILIKIRV